MAATKKNSKTEALYSKAVHWVKRRGFSKVKVNTDLEEFDKPTSFNREDADKAVTPDITAMRRGRKSYFEIAIKGANERFLVTKWKLMARLARLKQGKFYLLAPHGHRTFANRLIKRYGINAEVVSL